MAKPRPGRRSGVADHLRHLGRFIRNPQTIGAVAPSSATLARRMVAGLDFGPGVRIVELGPGTGAFTRAIVERLGSSGRYLGIDLEPTFVEEIHQRWPDLDVVCASAERLAELADARGLAPVDHIVSGLPFASLPRPMTRGILAGIQATLRPGGTFTTFVYFHSFGLPPAIAFRRDMTELMGTRLESWRVMRNVPPAIVMRWSMKK